MSLPMDDTICAIATPPGEGGIGIVRISGEKAVAIASGVARVRAEKPFDQLTPHTLYRADILNPAATRHDDARHQWLDEALVVRMPRPRSYTGEDLVEIHCHGGPLILQRVCEILVAHGARLAQPGEFTKRAFLNGKLDLAQAEAVLDTIRAQTAGSLRLAQDQLRGVLSREIDRVRERLIGMLAHVEAGIDFTEEDLSFIDQQELLAGLHDVSRDLSRLVDSTREGRILREGITTAIIGRPNVGKSSLLNALLRTDRAIVTAIPGTTRDVLEETLNLRGIPVRLLDTAGLRDTDDPVEHEGIRRSRQAMEQAELILLLLDGSVPLTEADRELMDACGGRPVIYVLNKSDLPRCVQPDQVAPDSVVVCLSAATGVGLDDLRDRIRDRFLRPQFEPAEAAVVTSLRHRTSLLKAVEALDRTAESARARLSGEFAAMDLRVAIDALGEITGTVTTDDILDRIFADFCIGK